MITQKPDARIYFRVTVFNNILVVFDCILKKTVKKRSHDYGKLYWFEDIFFWSFFGYLHHEKMKNKICNNLFNKRGYKLYQFFRKWTIFLKWKTVKMSYFDPIFYLHISLFILFHITSFLRRIFSMIIVWTLLNLTGQVSVTWVDFFFLNGVM